MKNTALLPVKHNTWGRPNADSQYALMGIKIIGTSVNDDLLYNVELPKGWRLSETDHPFWTDLLDEKGRKRASIWNDTESSVRECYVDFFRRYSLRENFEDKFRTSYYVIDTATNEVIFETEQISKDYLKEDDGTSTRDSLYNSYMNEKVRLCNECGQWLNKNFPKEDDYNAYWD